MASGKRNFLVLRKEHNQIYHELKTSGILQVQDAC